MGMIQCPVCSGNEFVKKGDLFMCQYCGTSYTPEDYKKLFVELKLDRSDEAENLRKLAKTNYGEKKFSEARDQWKRILEIKPDDCEATLYNYLLDYIFSKSWNNTPAQMKRVYGMMKDQISDRQELTKVIKNATDLISDLFKPADFVYNQFDLNGRSSIINMYSDIINVLNALFPNTSDTEIIAPSVAQFLWMKIVWLENALYYNDFDNDNKENYYNDNLKRCKKMFEMYPFFTRFEDEYNSYIHENNLNFQESHSKLLKDINECVVPEIDRTGAPKKSKTFILIIVISISLIVVKSIWTFLVVNFSFIDNDYSILIRVLNHIEYTVIEELYNIDFCRISRIFDIIEKAPAAVWVIWYIKPVLIGLIVPCCIFKNKKESYLYKISKEKEKRNFNTLIKSFKSLYEFPNSK